MKLVTKIKRWWCGFFGHREEVVVELETESPYKCKRCPDTWWRWHDPQPADAWQGFQR